MPGLLSNEAAGRQAFIFRDGRPMIRLGDSKTRGICPSESNPARIQASLSSPFWRGTVPAQPFSRFSPPPRLISGYHIESISLSRKMKCFLLDVIDKVFIK